MNKNEIPFKKIYLLKFLKENTLCETRWDGYSHCATW